MARKSLILIVPAILIAPLLVCLASVGFAAIIAISAFQTIRQQAPEDAMVWVTPGFNVSSEVPAPVLIGSVVLTILIFVSGLWFLLSNRKSELPSQ